MHMSVLWEALNEGVVERMIKHEELAEYFISSQEFNDSCST